MREGFHLPGHKLSGNQASGTAALLGQGWRDADRLTFGLNSVSSRHQASSAPDVEKARERGEGQIRMQLKRGVACRRSG